VTLWAYNADRNDLLELLYLFWILNNIVCCQVKSPPTVHRPDALPVAQPTVSKKEGKSAYTQWRQSQVKSGDKYWEEWRGGVWGGAVPSPVGVWGLAPRKNQFCAKKNHAILSKFWYFFPILQHKNFHHAKIVTSALEKVGDYPSPKSGGPIPPAPTPMRTPHEENLSYTRH